MSKVMGRPAFRTHEAAAVGMNPPQFASDKDFNFSFSKEAEDALLYEKKGSIAENCGYIGLEQDRVHFQTLGDAPEIDTRHFRSVQNEYPGILYQANLYSDLVSKTRGMSRSKSHERRIASVALSSDRPKGGQYKAMAQKEKEETSRSPPSQEGIRAKSQRRISESPIFRKKNTFDKIDSSAAKKFEREKRTSRRKTKFTKKRMSSLSQDLGRKKFSFSRNEKKGLLDIRKSEDRKKLLPHAKKSNNSNNIAELKKRIARQMSTYTYKKKYENLFKKRKFHQKRNSGVPDRASEKLLTKKFSLMAGKLRERRPAINFTRRKSDQLTMAVKRNFKLKKDQPSELNHKKKIPAGGVPRESVVYKNIKEKLEMRKKQNTVKKEDASEDSLKTSRFQQLSSQMSQKVIKTSIVIDRKEFITERQKGKKDIVNNKYMLIEGGGEGTELLNIDKNAPADLFDSICIGRTSY